MISLLNPLRSATLDSANFLYHKDSAARLFLKVDACDAGWGACAYHQMVHPWTGDPEEEGRGRQGQGDTGARKTIQWISQQGMDGVGAEISFPSSI
jgi:hypothetical protein